MYDSESEDFQFTMHSVILLPPLVLISAKNCLKKGKILKRINSEDFTKKVSTIINVLCHSNNSLNIYISSELTYIF